MACAKHHQMFHEKRKKYLSCPVSLSNQANPVFCLLSLARQWL
jgi:hypothetical protein